MTTGALSDTKYFVLIAVGLGKVTHSKLKNAPVGSLKQLPPPKQYILFGGLLSPGGVVIGVSLSPHVSGLVKKFNSFVIDVNWFQPVMSFDINLQPESPGHFLGRVLESDLVDPVNVSIVGNVIGFSHCQTPLLLYVLPGATINGIYYPLTVTDLGHYDALLELP